MRVRFAREILPHLDRAYRYARSLARDDNLAEDVVREAFVRALRSFHNCHGDGRAWLFAIVRNCWFDAQRTRSRLVALPEDGEEPVDHDDPEIQVARAEASSNLRSMIAALPEPFREVIVLRELEELSYKEIAVITAVPIGTVMSRLARARAMLSTMVLGAETRGAA